MDIRARPQLVKKLKQQAADEGLTLTGFLLPFLNDIAAGRLVRRPVYPPQAEARQAA